MKILHICLSNRISLKYAHLKYILIFFFDCTNKPILEFAKAEYISMTVSVFLSRMLWSNPGLYVLDTRLKRQGGEGKSAEAVNLRINMNIPSEDIFFKYPRLDLVIKSPVILVVIWIT